MNELNRRRLLTHSAVLAAAPFLAVSPARSQSPSVGSRSQSTAPLWRWNAVDLATAIRSRKISSREATTSCLDRIDQVNPKVNAMAEVLRDEAMAAADLADQAIRAGGPIGRLHGVPVTTKINVDLRGHATTNGVVAFKNNIATEDGAPVRNLRNDGAVIIGRTNVPAFSFRWFTDNDLYGRTLNPGNASVTPGGSSGGAAAAVATGMGPLAHGTDIAGSVRYPAYACGVAGIRPTPGRVPNFSGGQPRAITTQLMSVAGLLARRVRDLRFGLPTLAQRDIRDPWWVPAPATFEGPNRPLKVALLKSLDGITPDPPVIEGLQRAAKALEGAGYAVEEATPPHFTEAAELWSPLVITEARTAMVPAIQANGDEKIKKELAAWLEITPPLDLAGFSKALGRWEQLQREWLMFMQNYPIIVTPCSWKKQFPIDLDQQGPSAMRDILKAQSPMLAIALLGLPGLSVPTGIVDGLPTGIQVVAGKFREDLCFEAGEVIESAVEPGTPLNPRT